MRARVVAYDALRSTEMRKSTKRSGLAVFLWLGLIGTTCGHSANILTTDNDDNTNPESSSDSDLDIDTGIETETGTDSSSGTGICLGDEVEAGEVVLIGDSWIMLPSTHLQDLAHTEGPLGPDESYVVLADNGKFIDDIIGQYNAREAGVTKVNVLIMDGGGMDTIFSLESIPFLVEIRDDLRFFITPLSPGYPSSVLS
jgi:hypothetical protein